ncbi:MAG: sugar ABC transporter permease [Chloroflexi bacterium]|nr:sugar ABC transporter permease [Chloroflexota bacterium]
MTISILAARKPGRPGSLKRQEIWYFHLFVLPWIIGFAVFVAYPILASLYFSFTKYNVLNPPKWIGLANYAQLFHSRLFWKSLGVTLHYTVLALPLSLVLGLLIATFLNARVPGMRMLRTIYYLPTLVPPVAAALLWTWLLNPQFGLINFVLFWALHIQGPAWLTSQTWVIPAIVLMSLWGFGGNMIIYLAAMQGIPEEYYDAAAIDGAGTVRRFISITIPLLTPAIFFTLILGLIGSFQVFSQVYVLTQGGPNYASYFYNLYLYQNAFQFFKMGLASAQAWILFLIILACTLLLFRSSGSWVNYER